MTYTHTKHDKKTVANGRRAAVVGRCGKAPSALEKPKNSHSNMKTAVYRTKTGDLFPVLPVKSGLFPVLQGTTFLNDDNHLQAFYSLFPVFPVFFAPNLDKTA